MNKTLTHFKQRPSHTVIYIIVHRTKTELQGLLFNDIDHFSALLYSPQHIQPVSLSLPPERGEHRSFSPGRGVKRRESAMTPKSSRKRKTGTSSAYRSFKVQQVKTLPQQNRKNKHSKPNITECTRSMRPPDPKPKVCYQGTTADPEQFSSVPLITPQTTDKLTTARPLYPAGHKAHNVSY